MSQEHKLKSLLLSHQISVHCVPDEEFAKDEGVIINNRYYWLNCCGKLNIEVLARALDIARPECWKYKEEQFKGKTIEVAELLNVCWLNVQGSQHTGILTDCTEYEVLFDIKLNHCASGWCKPVNFSFTGPDGREKTCQLRLDHYIGQGYFEVSVGKFTKSCGCKSNVQFKLYEHGGHWKSGLVVRGVIIRAIS